ncbi:exocyst complex component sec8 [Magnaporthiopsis poae ATCC 64411]|uniref:Exocyst complex component Sec8 n=1 Tax=Magnaporthiopsis poae (strain ATCC 64411 / 73-15) TaxID=644358 RepID=A0A0C4E8S7_MAGP6|nr:exocyst complex component sec8 [Magnaporthiopsis poae ATCC 64411]
MSNRYGGSSRNGNGYGNFGGRSQDDRDGGDYDPYGDGYGNGGGGGGGGGGNRYGDDGYGGGGSRYGDDRYTESPRSMNARGGSLGYESSAERQIAQVLEHIKKDWPAMCQTDCVPVQLALQLLDNSSVGRAHEYRNFQNTHRYLQDSLKNIVHDYHQGFNSSIGTFHKIQGSIQASQKKVRGLKESLAAAKVSLCTTDPELKKLYNTSQMYDDLLQALAEVDELRQVPDQLEARISEKRFLTAVEVLQTALRKLTKPELDGIGALVDLRSYLANQETALMDILVEELHEHLYLKSPYCQERWQNLAKSQGSLSEAFAGDINLAPFLGVLDTMDLDRAVQEDPGRNPEADTFYYISLVIESLNKLGRLEAAVDTLKQRLPVELFSIVNETINEVDQKHPSSLRGGSTGPQGLHVYGSRETQLRADVIYDLLWTLYGKFEAIAEGHRVLHEYIKSLIRREGAGNNIALLGSFKELWNLYQNEIRSLLHSYVTTDADVYHFNSPKPGASSNGASKMRQDLFKFSDSDVKSAEMTIEYEELDGIIRAAVPGLTSGTRKPGDKKQQQQQGQGVGRGDVGKRGNGIGGFEGNSRQSGDVHKSLVEPSVFNMSLLLPPTLVFLQRLKGIVPPGSDLATSTLTSFLDNFLVNVFQPQLDETLGKLSDTVFGESDSFQQDPDWSLMARRPVFKGTTAFFAIVTAFCRMLGTIPHDQALSTLIIAQMKRYYDRCSGWYRALVAKTDEEANAEQQTLRVSALMATQSSEMLETMRQLWMAEGGVEANAELLAKEIALLVERTNEKRLEMGDIISDRDTISSLCLLYTSMKWLATKVVGLRHITKSDADSSNNLPKQQGGRRWTLFNDPAKATTEHGPVYLPMTQETVNSFDGIVTSYEELAGTALLTLHMEVRCRIVYSLRTALSPDTAPYLLDQEVTEPDPQIISLNGELVAYDETTARFLREREVSFVRQGLGMLINSYLVGNAPLVSPMNSKGCGRMRLNILVLQQNLKNIEGGVSLSRADDYFSLFEAGPDAIVERAKTDAAAAAGEGSGHRFSYDELKALIELCFSEQLSNPERGIASAAKRQMADKMLTLSEQMWQT